MLLLFRHNLANMLKVWLEKLQPFKFINKTVLWVHIILLKNVLHTPIPRVFVQNDHTIFKHCLYMFLKRPSLLWPGENRRQNNFNFLICHFRELKVSDVSCKRFLKLHITVPFNDRIQSFWVLFLSFEFIHNSFHHFLFQIDRGLMLFQMAP